MSWRFSYRFVLVATVAVAGALALPARADEAFLCGPDTVVYVSAADLPMKKRTDPCIAAYFGLEAEAPQPAEARPKASQPALSKHSAPVAAVRKAQTPAKPVRAIAAQLKPSSELEAPANRTPSYAKQAALLATHAAPLVEPGADYRTVRILNAATPASQWFHHKK